MKISDLNHLYNDCESHSHELFSEMRSNILLVAGHHYSRFGGRRSQVSRNAESISRQQKIRLTKNYIQKVTKSYVNNLISLAPGVHISPRNESEIQDIKSADLNGAVWDDIKRQHKMKVLARKLAEDFIQIGEFWLKIFYDPDAGHLLGYRQEKDEQGNVYVDEDGQPIDFPVWSGDLVYERWHGFNVLVDQDARSYGEDRWLIGRKMLPVRDLRYRYRDDEEKLSYIHESAEQTYKIFNGVTGTYGDADGLTMVREFYFRPNKEYPNGYFYYATEAGVLEQGELPLGIWPIVHKGFDEISTSARSSSIIRVIRPQQAEVNRAGSKMAEHQITIGDDKVVTLGGGNLSPGATAHGVKHIKASGPVTVLPGRTGEQYLPYLQYNASEMLNLANLPEDAQREPAQLDPYTLLFRSLKEKKAFTIYSDKFEEGLVEICEISLRLKRAYIKDEELIPIIGKRELVNVREFRRSDDLSYQIKIDPMAEDIESKMGKQLTMTHIMQYVGQQLTPQMLGKLIRQMPYMNAEKAFEDFTIDEDNANNDVLALDRGEYPPTRPQENNEYMISRLIHRMKQPDFNFLRPNIRTNYERKYQEHIQALTMKQQQAAMANSGFIPSGGYLVSCDFYLPDANTPGGTRRARVPYEALDWLLKKLTTQGQSQQAIQQMDLAAQADIGQAVAGGGGGMPSQQDLAQMTSMQ